MRRTVAAAEASDDEVTVIVARPVLPRTTLSRGVGEAGHRQPDSTPDTVVVTRVRPAPHDEVHLIYDEGLI